MLNSGFIPMGKTGLNPAHSAVFWKNIAILLFLPYLIIRDCLHVDSPDRDQIDRIFVLCMNPFLGSCVEFQKDEKWTCALQFLGNPLTFTTS